MKWLIFSISILLAACTSGSAESPPAEIEVEKPTATATLVPTNTVTPTLSPSPTATPLAGGGWLAFMEVKCFANGGNAVSSGRLHLLNVESGEDLILNDDASVLQEKGLASEKPCNLNTFTDKELRFSVSPSGNAIAYVSSKDGTPGLYVIELDTLKEEKMLDLSTLPFEIIWLEGSDWIIMVQGPPGDYNRSIWGYQGSTGEHSQFKNVDDLEYGALVSKMGADFSFHNLGGSLMGYNFQTQSVELINESIDSWAGVWNFDGSKYIFRDNKLMNTQVLNKISGGIKIIYTPEFYSLGNFRNADNYTFSPDGNKIALGIIDVVNQGINDFKIIIMDLERNRIASIGDFEDNSMLHNYPVWSLDGNWIAYFSIDRSSESRDSSGSISLYNLNTAETYKLIDGLDEKTSWSVWFQNIQLP